MSDSIDVRLESLRTAMQVVPGNVDELMSLISAGEAVRRIIAGAEDIPRDGEELEEQYLMRIRQSFSVSAPDLETRLESALSALESHAGKRLHARDPHRGEKLLEDIDRVLATSAAGARFGFLPDSLKNALARRARSRAQSLAARLSDLWPAAAMRERSLGPDPEDSELYSWTHELASLSAGGRAMSAALYGRSERERGRLLDELVASVSGARVYRLEFRRRAPVMELAAHAPGELHEDPGKWGEVVYAEGGVEIRVREILEREGASSVGVRVRLEPSVSGDLAAKGAVTVHALGAGGERGAPLRPITSDCRPLVWWATFAAGGRLLIAVPELGVEHELEIARPDV